MASSERKTIAVEKLVYGGDALARVNGQVLLVPFVLPGEEIEVDLQPAKGKTLRGVNARVVHASPHRVSPPCEYFSRCGGCHYQHADYEYQLAQKTAVLKETLQRIGGFSPQCEVVCVAGEPWAYRNRIQLHFEQDQLGFRMAGSHKLYPITHCPISSPKLNEVITTLVGAIHEPQWPRFLRELEIFTNEKDVQLHVVSSTKPVAARFFSWCSEMIPGVVPGALDYQAGGHLLRISRGTFFQVNRWLIDPLINEVMQYSGRSALDLYAGAGLFSLPLSARFESVIAVESGGPAHRDLEHNAQLRSDRLAVARSRVEDFLEQFTSNVDLVVADPPRSGLGPEVVTELGRLRAENVVIVSCDPATLARDLKSLLAAYEIRRLAMVDLFPQTFHFETVAHLERKGASRGEFLKN